MSFEYGKEYSDEEVMSEAPAKFEQGKTYSDTDLMAGFSSSPTMTATPPEETGYVKGTMQALGRGVIGGAEFLGDYLESDDDYMRSGLTREERDESLLGVTGQAGRFVSEKAKALKELIPKPMAGESKTKQAIFGGTESAPLSVALMAPSLVGAVGGAAGGAALGTAVTPVLGTAAGIMTGRLAGAAGGAAVTSHVMFEAVKQQTLEELDEMQADGRLREGVTQEEKMAAAEAAGHAEWQGEAPANIVEALIFSRLPAAGLLKGILKPGLKQFGKNIAKTAPLEVAGEMYTSYAQTGAVNPLLKPEYQSEPFKTSIDSIGPTLVTTAIMNGMGIGVQRLSNHSIVKNLENENAPIADRVKSINTVTEMLRKSHGDNIADTFAVKAQGALGIGGEASTIDLNDPALIDGGTVQQAPMTPQESIDAQVDAEMQEPIHRNGTTDA